MAFHAVRVPAGGEVVIGLAFPSNPEMCRDPSGQSVTTQSSVTARFTVLGVFHNSQAVALDPPLSMRSPTAAQCAAAAR
jgi:hypothetical protein